MPGASGEQMSARRFAPTPIACVESRTPVSIAATTQSVRKARRDGEKYRPSASTSALTPIVRESVMGWSIRLRPPFHGRVLSRHAVTPPPNHGDSEGLRCSPRSPHFESRTMLEKTGPADFYRVYHIDTAGHYVDHTNFMASDDGAACSTALGLQEKAGWPSMELWVRHREVSCPAEPADVAAPTDVAAEIKAINPDVTWGRRVTIGNSRPIRSA